MVAGLSQASSRRKFLRAWPASNTGRSRKLWRTGWNTEMSKAPSRLTRCAVPLLLLSVAPAQNIDRPDPLSPRVSSVVRGAAFEKVAGYLETSQGVIEQAAVLVPF